MDSYFICLEPEKKLGEKINSQKRFILQNIGQQAYLDHPPHTTLFVFTTNDLTNIERRLGKIKEFKEIIVEIDKMDVFYDDAFTGGNTAIYSFREDSLEKLRDIQKKSFKMIEEFLTKELFKEKLRSLKNLGDAERKNIETYDFPYFGNNWIPHITLASIDKDLFSKVFGWLKENEIKGSFKLDAISLYKNDEPPTLIKKWRLKNGS